jgi:C-terminal processing protease CtpA/Prc
VVRTHSIFATRTNWSEVRSQAHQLAASATFSRGTYPAIQYVLNQLHDPHAELVDPSLKGNLSGGGPLGFSPPTVQLTQPRIGYVELPALYDPSSSSTKSTEYMTAALQGEAQLERQGVCGWVIDLRNNGGGNVDPMRLAVGPLLGQGSIGGTQTPAGITSYVFYGDGALREGTKTVASAPVRVADFSPPPPVAVLTGPLTRSAGEGVVIAFVGRPGAQSFGAATGGGPDPTGTFTLSDGAVLYFEVQRGVDRFGHTYDGPIPPDVPIASTAPGADPTLQAGVSWLLSSAACS